PASRSSPRPRAEEAECRPGIVVLEDLLGLVALLGHSLGAPLGHAHAVAVAAAGETGDRAVERNREERRLDGLVADHATEIVAAQPRGAPGAVNGQARHAERGRALGHLDRGDGAHVVAISLR